VKQSISHHVDVSKGFL